MHEPANEGHARRAPPGPEARPSRARLVALGALALLGVGWLAPPAPAPDDDGLAAVDDARAAVGRWVETRRLISRERRDWALGRELLQDRVALVRKEIEGLRARIAEAEASIAEADRKRADLVAQGDALKAVAARLQQTLVRLEGRAQALLARLPEHLTQNLRPISQRLPGKDGVSTLSLSERFLNVVGILDTVDKFHRELHATSEVRRLEDGSSVEVTVLYAGLGQAWYTGAQGRIAGIGTANAEGWTWRRADEIAAAVGLAVAVHKTELPATYAQLPVRID